MLWVYAVVRADDLSFTHDESLSFTIVQGDYMRKATPNHHYLNTWCMALATRLGQTSELGLRWGSLLACILFLSGLSHLLARTPSRSVQCAGFALLALNPFLFDFFSLARGYAWMLAGIMGMAVSLCQLSADEAPADRLSGKTITRWTGMGLLSGALAVLGNLAALAALLPYLALLAWVLYWRCGWFSRGLRLVWGVYGSLYAGLLGFVLSEAFRLKARGELYFGGKEGFIDDTLNSLVTCSLYLKNYGPLLPKILSGWAIGSAAFLFAGAGRAIGVTRQPGFLALTGAWLAMVLAFVLLQFWCLHTPLPTDRMAVYFLALFGIAMLAGLTALARAGRLQNRVATVVSSVIALACLGHFVRTANTQHCYMWHYDKHTRSIMQLIPAMRHQPGGSPKMTMATHALFEPAANFYRITKGYTWLELIPKEGVQDRVFNCYYTLWDNFDQIPEREGTQQEIVTFEDTRSALWLRK